MVKAIRTVCRRIMLNGCSAANLRAAGDCIRRKTDCRVNPDLGRQRHIIGQEEESAVWFIDALQNRYQFQGQSQANYTLSGGVAGN